MNSPRALSSVNPLTPLPVVSTKFALAAYIPVVRKHYFRKVQYPATSISVPGRRTSATEGLSTDESGSLYIPKMVPTDTPASRFDDPKNYN